MAEQLTEKDEIREAASPASDTPVRAAATACGATSRTSSTSSAPRPTAR